MGTTTARIVYVGHVVESYRRDATVPGWTARVDDEDLVSAVMFGTRGEALAFGKEVVDRRVELAIRELCAGI